MRWYRRLCRWVARPAPTDERGYALAFWAIFLATVIVPLMVLAWDVGRLFYARGEIQKAADAAALAAAREVDVPRYMQTGEVLLHQGAIAQASYYAQSNIAYLPRAGISPRITRIVVNNVTKTVFVQMQADVSPLFPDFLNVRPISVWGEAQVRMSRR
jgi:Flp pilus assembly protein TadG